ncbi:MAG: hypothetical protein A3C70_02505 [Candidatus Zambryskibacteria bacterium RIFCSPHIGHO2_02_FULL_43_14]|uniref:Uncharacterized protein n=1 Tax=Candidatus Zambryskibacteria bacterium RIFCSPHIGHO2_02_FULL_43_14 TaxID=1802748 RepID=A0A1G2TIB6_9BACT|nr:MAG: hypothetical protein A2829_00195 [Candidatus Zambryskibacteria bacterium RIFCSPHIGHO2_01_FULL_43_60]OHA97027.1 MAG: hypothetical protein A3C70_02505 [Candidatus Zambryskibacteria bacterium RIFCSPHIGHO2_02_FULL_43_14]OHB03752.1 MAG: hypothetical protein A3B03_02060 [Candidatus Zambryskibacteria bacterium RIFCSPLOWO2_01_FULL_42_41]
MNETDKLIAEQLKTLPPSLQQAISAVPWKALVQEIGKANTLDTEQIVSLEQETMLVVYGLENPNDYVSNIIKEVGVSEEVAYTIAGSVVDKIFEPILRKSEEFEKSVTPAITPVSAPATPPANLPMVEAGEVAHEVPHIEQTTPIPAPQKPEPKASLPDYRYEQGKDPYREPLA